jgi:hypothetical protein
MPTYICELVEGKPISDWKAIYAEAAKHKRSRVTVESYSEKAEQTDQQRKWWKGVLLPALAADSGDSISYWETRLKLAVMPEEFIPETKKINGVEFTFVPSITKLSMKQFNHLIEGSVEVLWGWGFDWVTLPDSSLRVDK